MRCFIAIELSDEIRKALDGVARGLKPAAHGNIKWVDPGGIHLTLKFLGNIEEETLEKINEVLHETASLTAPFTIRLSSAGAFPSPKQPRVIWVGIDKGKDESVALAHILEEKLLPLGFRKEARAYHPHLTVARVKFVRNRDVLGSAIAAMKVPPIEMPASKITLFQSTLTPSGALYTSLATRQFT